MTARIVLVACCFVAWFTAGAPSLQADGAELLVDPNTPGAFATIQAAVDAGAPGDTILIAPGVYEEEVYVTTPRLTLQGLDREAVVLFGDAEGPACDEGLGVGIWIDGADDVAVDNLTVLNYTEYGVYWSNVQGFWGSRITAGDNCVYGLLTHDSEVGELAWSEAYGSGDSGLYTGEANECRCVLHHNDVHDNMIGYSGTKGNGVEIRDNWFHQNGVGLLPNTLTPDAEHYVLEHLLPGLMDGQIDPFGEDAPQQCCVRIHNNLIEANNNGAVPPHGFTETIKLPVGTGVELAGASNNTVEHNLIRGHDRWGLAIHWLFVAPDANRVLHNTLKDNAQADLWWDGWGVGNCFEGNAYASSDPSTLPACGPLPSLGPPDPTKDALLACIAVGLCP